MRKKRCNKDAVSSRLPALLHRQGFSLIELLIASIVIASAAALLAGSLIAANQHADRRIDQILATQELASQLALLDETVPEIGSASGTSPSSEKITWTLQCAKADPPLAPLIKAILTVYRNGYAAHVVTYRRVKAP